MNRIIKFRAWDIDIEQMWDWEQVQKIDKWWIHKGIILMQFTGLIDKNGKEIYEGDIYRVAVNRIYVVEFCSGEESNHEWYGGSFIIRINKEVFFPFDEFAIKNGEVIGNIYENPEILK